MNEKIKSQVEAIDDLREGYEMLLGKRKKESSSNPYIQLSPTMNNYEINIILGKFLELWSRDTDLPYVRVTLIVSTFKLYNCGIVDKFFPEGCVFANQFFQFVCTVCFLNFHQMNLLILSKCKIHSNYLITHDQIMDYMGTYDRDHQCDLTAFFHDYLIDVPDAKAITYSLKAFTSYIDNNKILETNFQKVKQLVNREIFSKERIEKIIKRYEFFTDLSPNHKIPKESCINKLKRKINHEPPPFHFDYCINKSRCEYTNSDNYIDTLVYMIKQTYGYGYRSSKSKVTIQRSNSSINQSIGSNVNNNNNNNNNGSIISSNVKNANMILTPIQESTSYTLRNRLNDNKSRNTTRSRSFLTSTIKSNNLGSTSKCIN